MQLGTRWSVGEEPPGKLPASVRAAIRDVETELAARDTTSWRWTLTWLEGRPITQLDDGTTIRFNAHDDTATTTVED